MRHVRIIISLSKQMKVAISRLNVKSDIMGRLRRGLQWRGERVGLAACVTAADYSQDIALVLELESSIAYSSHSLNNTPIFTHQINIKKIESFILQFKSNV